MGFFQVLWSAFWTGLKWLIILGFVGMMAWGFLEEDQERESVEFDEEEVAKTVVIYTNEERTDRGRQKLEWSPRIARSAQRHAENMADHGYVGHQQPDGTTAAERYDGLCDYTESEYLHGENVGGTFWKQRVDTSGDSGVRYISNNSVAAEDLVRAWMNSEGHRENMLEPSWTKLGVGVAKDENGEIYAAQVFC